MSHLKATNTPVVIDNLATPPQTTGSTTIGYDKDPDEELWELPPSGSWTQLNVHLLTGLGNAADFSGSYSRTLTAGQIYRAGLFERDHGPLATDPLPRADVTVFAILKRPPQRNLIITDVPETGGTFHRRTVRTSVDTSVAVVGASRTPATVDADGIPSLVDPDGGLSSPTGIATSHTMDLLPLVPGNHYFFTVMVVDAQGNWDVRQREFDTLRRKLTIMFPRIHIYNDGDPATYGEGEFWFRVSAGNEIKALSTMQEFHLPEQDIDDWFETDRPYAVGFAYTDLDPQTVPPVWPSIWVNSWGVEHDGLDFDEGAGSFKGTKLDLPVGPGEKVTHRFLTMDCPTSTVDDDFHYGVDIEYSVEYLP